MQGGGQKDDNHHQQQHRQHEDTVGQRDNVGDHMVNVVSQINLDMASRLEPNKYCTYEADTVAGHVPQ